VTSDGANVRLSRSPITRHHYFLILMLVRGGATVYSYEYQSSNVGTLAVVSCMLIRQVRLPPSTWLHTSSFLKVRVALQGSEEEPRISELKCLTNSILGNHRIRVIQ
jgi:hypothetical protein